MVETVDTLVAYYRKQILTLHIVFSFAILCLQAFLKRIVRYRVDVNKQMENIFKKQREGKE